MEKWTLIIFQYLHIVCDTNIHHQDRRSPGSGYAYSLHIFVQKFIKSCIFCMEAKTFQQGVFEAKWNVLLIFCFFVFLLVTFKNLPLHFHALSWSSPLFQSTSNVCPQIPAFQSSSKACIVRSLSGSFKKLALTPLSTPSPHPRLRLWLYAT